MTAWKYLPSKTAEVFDFLVESAQVMRTRTYREVADETGLAAVGVGKPLGFIRDEVCRHNHWPWLNALVVNSGKLRPGDEFVPGGFKGSPEEQELYWRGMVLQVFAFDWSRVSFGDEVAAWRRRLAGS